jgi:hypothetical protein
MSHSRVSAARSNAPVTGRCRRMSSPQIQGAAPGGSGSAKYRLMARD